MSDSTNSYKDTDDGSSEFDGFSLEFGASYYFPNFPEVSLSGGYKYQKYTDKNDDDIKFMGFTFGANYRF